MPHLHTVLLFMVLWAGPLFASSRMRCVLGCGCRVEDVEGRRSIPLATEDGEKAHLIVGCTRGHNVSLTHFFEKLEKLNLNYEVFKELTLEGLLIPTFSLSDFSQFPRLSILNLPNNRISRMGDQRPDFPSAAESAKVDNVVDGVFVSPTNGAVTAQSEDDDRTSNSAIGKRILAVDLRNNAIRLLDGAVLQKMPNLKVLNLGSNNLHVIAENAFTTNLQLGEVYLQDNFIMTLPQFTFQSLENLEVLDLSRNQIFYIHDGAFSNQRRLRHLSLSTNFLTVLPRVTLETLPSTTRLSIQHNPFQCACGIDWLLNLLRERSDYFEESDSILCASPPNLVDRQLTSLNSSSPSLLPCDVPVISVSAIAGSLYTGTLPGSIYDSLFGRDDFDDNSDNPSTVSAKRAVVFVHGDVELSCDVAVGIWPRPSLLWELPSGKKMAIPHAHHISQQLIDRANITDFESFQMKPLDSEHTIAVAPPGILRLTDFRYPLAGNYTCHALSPAGNATASFMVDIQSAVWKVYIASLLVSFATVAFSIIVASAVGLVVLLVTHFENKKLQSTGLDGTPPIYPTPEESPQMPHRLLTIPVNAAMFENIKDGYDSLRSKLKTGLDKRMEKGRLLVELAWVSGETAITGLKEGTSTGIHKIDNVVRESGVAFSRGIRSGGAAMNKSIRSSSAHVTQAVYRGLESVTAVKENVLSLKDLCGGAQESVCGETPAIEGVVEDFGGIENFGAAADGRFAPFGVDAGTMTMIINIDRDADFVDDEDPATTRVSKVDANKRSKLKKLGRTAKTSLPPPTCQLEVIAEVADVGNASSAAKDDVIADGKNISGAGDCDRASIYIDPSTMNSNVSSSSDYSSTSADKEDSSSSSTSADKEDSSSSSTSADKESLAIGDSEESILVENATSHVPTSLSHSDE